MLRAAAIKEREFLRGFLRRIQEARLAPGSRLPVEREQMLEFGVSRTTVRRALQRLEDAQLIERRQGKGIFLRSTPTNSIVERVLQAEVILVRSGRRLVTHQPYRFAFLHDRAPDDPVLRKYLNGILNFAESRGHSVSVGSSRTQAPVEDETFSAEVYRPSHDGLIIAATFWAQDQSELAKIPVPYVLLADQPVANAFSIDVPAFCRQGVSVLVEKGYRSIAVLEKSYSQIRPSLGHVCNDLREELQLPSLKYFSGEDPLLNVLRLRRRPEALLIKDDFYCREVLDRLETAGMVAGRDIEVISYANRGIEAGLPPTVGRIEFDLEEIGRLAAQTVEQKLEDQDAVTPPIRVGGRYVPGGVSVMVSRRANSSQSNP